MSLIPPNNPEIDLLLCCARTHINPEITERINLLVQKDVNWEFLLQSALRQRVMSLLYRNLKSVCSNGVPDEIMEKLRKHYLGNTARNLYLTGELLKVLALLEEQNVLAVPFKGPVLAERVYGDITLRQFVDLDILVRPNDASKARNLLMAHGYKPDVKLDDKQFAVYLKVEDDIALICEESRVIIELHWELTGRNSSFPVYMDLFENRLEIVELEGKKVHNLPPEELLLYLCIHGSKHCWESLEWICCVAELIQSNPALNWGQALLLARRVKCERIFFLGLFLAKDMISVNLPAKILINIESDPNIRDLAGEVYKNLFHKEDVLTKSEISNRFSSFHIKVRDRFSDKIRLILQMAICPTKEDWRLFPLPASLCFMHYGLRPTRLAVELVVLFLGRLSKSQRPLGLTRIFQKSNLPQYPD